MERTSSLVSNGSDASEHDDRPTFVAPEELRDWNWEADSVAAWPATVPSNSDGDPPKSVVSPILQQFCEDLVADAVARAKSQWPDVESPDIDWESVWASVPTGTPEEVASHAVAAAQDIADEVLSSVRSVTAPESPRAPLPALVLPGPDEAWQPPAPVFLAPPPPPIAHSASAALATSSPNAAVSVTVAISPREAALLSTDENTPDSEDAALATERLTRRKKRLHRAFVACGWMIDFGLILIAFVVWQVWGTSIEQGQAQQTLRQQFQTHVHSAPPATAATSGGPALIAANIRVPGPAEGSVVGHIQIPAIGVDQFVVEGTNESDLQKGPGHYVGTSMPGQAGNVAIAGHRTTYGAPFNNLNSLKIGDPITLTSDSGEQLTYVVSQSPVAVSPQDVSVLNTVNDNRLTLTTCNPRFSSTQRLVVVALLSEPHTVVASTPVVKPRVVSVVADPIGWNMNYLLPVALFVVLMVALGLANRKARAVYGRLGRWLILVPIWAATILFLFESLTKLLPANL